MHFVMIHCVNEMHETTLHNTSMSCFTASYFKHTSIYRMCYLIANQAVHFRRLFGIKKKLA